MVQEEEECNEGNQTTLHDSLDRIKLEDDDADSKHTGDRKQQSLPQLNDQCDSKDKKVKLELAFFGF